MAVTTHSGAAAAPALSAKEITLAREAQAFDEKGRPDDAGGSGRIEAFPPRS